MATKTQLPQPSTEHGLAVVEWLTSAEAARHLKVKPRTLLLWVRQGKVKAYKLSGIKRHVWRFLRADLDAALFGNVRESIEQRP
jgi:excisionase family DNA binding protein